MFTSEIQRFQLLKNRLGETESKTLINFVDTKMKENNDINLTRFTTKEDITDLKLQISRLDSNLTLRMFYFWIGQVTVIAGLLVYFFTSFR